MSFKSLIKKMFVCGYWDIVVAESTNESSLCVLSKIKSSIFEWHADPFLLTVDNKMIVFCERKKISKKNGDICTYIFDGRRYKKNLLIKEPFHLSFPNIFKIEEKYFILPESSRGKTLRLYNYDVKDNKATLFKILKSDCSFVDSVFLKNDSGIHVFCYDTNYSLNHYLLGNDFKLDLISSISDDEKKLRPAGNPHGPYFYFQDCSNVYGETVVAKNYGNDSFSDISEDSYIEMIKRYCKDSGYSRFHTLNFDLNGNKFVFDVYKERINILKPFLMLWRLLCGNN